MVVVKVTSCKDPMRWYSSHIGESFVVIPPYKTFGEYVVREPAGYRNFIQEEDCEVVNGGN